MPITFFYPIMTQHDACCTLDGFEPYPEDCRVPVPDLSSSNDAKNLRRLRKYWIRVDSFVKEQYAGWKEREGQLGRMQEGSQEVRKRGQGERSESEDEHESPSKKKRTVSNFVMVRNLTEVKTRAFRAYTRISLTSLVRMPFVTSAYIRAGSANRVRMAAPTVLVLLARQSIRLVGWTGWPCQ